MYVNPAAVGQALRMAGQGLKNIGLTAAANPRLSATLGAGALGAIHGRVAGHNDPYSSGLGGSLGYGLLGGALGRAPLGRGVGAALGVLGYGLGQDTGSDRGALSKLKALDQAVLGGGAGNAAGVMPTEEQRIEEYLRKRESRQRLLQSIMNPFPGHHRTVGGNI